MRIRLFVLFVLTLIISNVCHAQTLEESYNSFKQKVHGDYQSFKEECNKQYIDFLRKSWEWYESKSPMLLPKEESPVPPRPYIGESGPIISTQPIEVKPIDNNPQPKPLEPIKEVTNPDEEYFSLNFYGQKCNVRLPSLANLRLNDCQPNSIATGWESLCNEEMNNAIRDCLETRIRYNLCDWAYLLFIDALCHEFCENDNTATLLTAFIYCQSGYQMRLAVDGTKLLLLYGSRHQIYNKGYFNVDGLNFYPLGEPANSISICNAVFEGETPMSLIIDKEQLLGTDMSVNRIITSEGNEAVSTVSQVPESLIEFYNSYPTSALDGNPMTRWAMYANTPLAQKTKEILYPSITETIKDCDEVTAANKLLSWIQTGFVYEYDDKVWGHDRAFFAEESLYYPYCDCEDRSILFSRLIRDLLGLDVALIYYPGHLATAVCFNEVVDGDAMMIDGRKFIVCDPTYIGAPVGVQMPNLEYDKAQAIVLNK